MHNRLSKVALVAAAAALLAGCSTPRSGSDDATYYYSNKGASAVAPVRPMPTPTNNQVGPQGVARIVYFDFDKYVVKPEYRSVVEAHANFLKNRRGAKVTLEGHTDERGGREYNLALGQRRAEAVRNMLTVLGVPDNQIDPISWGVEKPASLDRTELGYQLNRRVEFTYR